MRVVQDFAAHKVAFEPPQGVAPFRPSIMNNSYMHPTMTCNWQPPVSYSGMPLGYPQMPVGAGTLMCNQFSGGAPDFAQQSRRSPITSDKDCRGQAAAGYRQGAAGRRGRLGGSIKVTSSPAAALKLLTTPHPGAPTGVCEAPPSCRVPMDSERLARSSFLESQSERSASLERSSKRMEIMTSGLPDTDHHHFMIATPTGSVLDTMPSTPIYPASPDHEGMRWPPATPADIERHAPCGRHVASVYTPYQTEAAMNVLRLSEVLHSAVPLMGPGLRPLHGQGEQFMQPCAPFLGEVLQGSYSALGPGSESASDYSGVVDAIGAAEHRVQGAAAEIPSRGSALHAWRACKPCAFIFQEGCANGLECEFCHLCEPGERKRRKKERRVQKREDLLAPISTTAR